MANFESLSQSVIAGKEAQVKEQTQALIDSVLSPRNYQSRFNRWYERSRCAF